MPNNTLKDKAYLHLSTIKDAIVLSPDFAERVNLFHQFLGAKEAYINGYCISADDTYVQELTVTAGNRIKKG